jgi:hypothetical protein
MRAKRPTHNAKGEKLIWCFDVGFTRQQLNEWQKLADKRKTYGPSTVEHPETFEGECYCRLCLSYL